MAEKPGISERRADATDYSHRNRVNLIACGCIVALLLIGWFSAKMMFDQEKLQNCVLSGRKNCVELDVKPREGVFVPSH